MDTSTVDPGESPNTQIPNAQLTESLQRAAASADRLSHTRLDALAAVHQARIARRARAVSGLTDLHGSSDPQVLAAQRNLDATRTVATRVDLVRRQAIAKAPTVESGGWAVWGHVYNSAFHPLAAYTVFLVDEQKHYLGDYGYSATDAEGSFAIVFSPGQTKEDEASPEPSQKESTAPPVVFLGLADAKGKELVPLGAPLNLVFGRALYIDTVIPADSASLVTLPADVRKGAMPPSKKS